MPSDRLVRTSLRIDPAKLDRAREILGTRTEVETVRAALDLAAAYAPAAAVPAYPPLPGDDHAAFRAEVIAGLRRLAGTGIVRDIHAEDGEG